MELLGIAFGGGVSVKLLDILYNLYREKRSAKFTNTHAADDRLEPLLKAADEFVGKTWSLARKDFKTDIANQLADSPLSEHDVDSLVFSDWGILGTN